MRAQRTARAPGPSGPGLAAPSLAREAPLARPRGARVHPHEQMGRRGLELCRSAAGRPHGSRHSGLRHGAPARGGHAPPRLAWTAARASPAGTFPCPPCPQCLGPRARRAVTIYPYCIQILEKGRNSKHKTVQMGRNSKHKTVQMDVTVTVRANGGRNFENEREKWSDGTRTQTARDFSGHQNAWRFVEIRLHTSLISQLFWLSGSYVVHAGGIFFTAHPDGTGVATGTRSVLLGLCGAVLPDAGGLRATQIRKQTCC